MQNQNSQTAATSANDTIMDRIASNTPLMLVLTLMGVGGAIVSVIVGYYGVFQLVTFLGN